MIKILKINYLRKVIKISKNFFKKTIAPIILILVFFFNLSLSNMYAFTQIQNTDVVDVNKSLEVSQSELPDKIFTFFAPSDTLIFDLSLQVSIIYYIWIELATPHNVTTMRIRMWDPNNTQYDIFESEMFWDPSYGRYFEIPFGTALAGNYTIEFYVLTSKNVNILIYIEQGPMCLQDKMDWQAISNTIFYDVRKFHNEMYIEHFIQLKTDTMYKFYFARVSAISINESNDVYVDINITDAVGTEFEMLTYDKLQSIDGLSGFPFGTANSGIYTLKLKIYCQVDYVNIALAVVEDYAMGGGIDPNQTQPTPVNDTTRPANITAYIPTEATVTMFIFLGILVGIPVLLATYQRKKNNPELYFKTKKKK